MCHNSRTDPSIERLEKSPITITNQSVGRLRFVGTRLDQAADFCGQLCGRPVEVDPGLTPVILTMESVEELEPKEMLYGLELLFGLNGMALVPGETGSGLRLIPDSQLSGSPGR